METPSTHRPAQDNILSQILTAGIRELATPSPRRVPFLDVLRTIAVLLVLNAHASGEFVNHFGINAYTRFPLTPDGWIGVDLFFVLSGFFIGSQLLKEINTTGTISIRRFIIRRGLRIWPLYFFTFAVVFIATHGAPVQQHGWTDLVFLTNYIDHGIVAGAWSLCTEEQFYLLAPILLLLAGKRSMRAYLCALSALLGLVVVVRAATYIHYTGHFFAKSPAAFPHIYYPFHTHCDGLILGMMIATFYTTGHRFRGLLSKPRALTLITFAVVIALRLIRSDILLFLGLALFFSSLVWWGLQMNLKRFNGHTFYILSRLSFGMYLNHQYLQSWIVARVADGTASLHLNPALSSALSAVAVAIASTLLAFLTFCLVEHPFLMLRTHLLRQKLASPLVAH